MVLRAAILIRSDGSLHRNQNIVIDNGCIVDITDGSDGYADMHYAVVTPLFHNGHSHCEYDLLDGVIPSSEFFPWVRNVVQIKQCLPEHFWMVSSMYGVARLLRMGYASTADCCETWFTPRIMDSFGLDGSCYREVNGLNSISDVDRCNDAIDTISSNSDALTLGIAPHAIYSTCRDVLDTVRNRCVNLPLCIHVDESQDENRFCRFGDGAFVDMYHRREIIHPSPMTSAVAYFDKMGLLSPNTLLIHGCNWDTEDLHRVKQRGGTVAICPESNEFLRCKQSPVYDIYTSGIRMVIGTDSALSCPSMSPIQQLLRLMKHSSDEQFHRWLFKCQVTPDTGSAYDLRLAYPGDFCAFGLNEVPSAGGLQTALSGIATEVPHVYRHGKKTTYQLDTVVENAVRDTVMGLAR